MIRKLEETDRKQVLEYLYKELTYNIFIIGDIETFGFDKDFQTLYGEFNENNGYESVLLFYRENVVYYSHEIKFNTDYLDIMKQHNFQYVNAKGELAELLHPYLEGFGYKSMYFCEATELTNEVEEKDIEYKLVQSDEDIKKLFNLLIKINEFGIKSQSFEHFSEGVKISKDMGVRFIVEEDNQAVSTVATTAETTKNAMVVAVASHPDYREHGYASQLMIKLMREYFNKNKTLCLFYDNPKAGKIYKRLGFKDIGTWVMMSTLEK